MIRQKVPCIIPKKNKQLFSALVNDKETKDNFKSKKKVGFTWSVCFVCNVKRIYTKISFVYFKIDKWLKFAGKVPKLCWKCSIFHISVRNSKDLFKFHVDLNRKNLKEEQAKAQQSKRTSIVIAIVF